MIKKLLFAAACAASMAFGGAAAKADIVNLTSSPGSNTFTATSITFQNQPGSVAPPITGIFSVFTTATATTFAPVLWNAASGNETLTFTGPAANTPTFTFTTVTFDPLNT